MIVYVTNNKEPWRKNKYIIIIIIIIIVNYRLLKKDWLRPGYMFRLNNLGNFADANLVFNLFSC